MSELTLSEELYCYVRVLATSLANKELRSIGDSLNLECYSQKFRERLQGFKSSTIDKEFKDFF